jgi:hypothetical protein
MTRSRTPAPHPPTTAPEPSKTPKVEVDSSLSLRQSGVVVLPVALRGDPAGDARRSIVRHL